MAANWTNGIVAFGADQTADFSRLNLIVNPIITLDGARTIGNLIFGDTVPSHGWTLNTGSGGVLTLAGSNSTITVNNGSVTIGAVVAGTNAITKAGSGSLTLANNLNSFSGNLNINAGTVIANTFNNQTTTSSLGAKTGGRTTSVAAGATLSFTINNIFGGSGQNAANLPTVQVNGTLTTTRFNVLPNLVFNGGLLRNSNATDPANYDGFQFIGSVTVGGPTASTFDTTTGRGSHLAKWATPRSTWLTQPVMRTPTFWCERFFGIRPMITAGAALLRPWSKPAPARWSWPATMFTPAARRSAAAPCW